MSEGFLSPAKVPASDGGKARFMPAGCMLATGRLPLTTLRRSMAHRHRAAPRSLALIVSASAAGDSASPPKVVHSRPPSHRIGLARKPPEGRVTLHPGLDLTLWAPEPLVTDPYGHP